MDSPISPKDEIWFLHVCHHISNAVYLQVITVPVPHSGNDYKRLYWQRLDLTKKWKIVRNPAFPNNKERGSTERPSADFDLASK
jgi:hypothetical protein